uniref:Uncharacterized protein n=1 Tax=Lepeophtheirus salmonis TaxID=72036 RepID=A0A0K2V9Q5_LEPSM
MYLGSRARLVIGIFPAIMEEFVPLVKFIFYTEQFHLITNINVSIVLEHSISFLYTKFDVNSLIYIFH